MRQNFLARKYKLVLAALAAILITFSPSLSASAVVSPSSGPVAGGTSVTIDGIHFVKITSGSSHTLGLTSEGTVYAWGYNGFGQLGIGNSTHQNTPTQVVGVGGVGFLAGVTDVVAGAAFSMAITPSGLVSWGFNSVGQLGIGNTTTKLTPTQVLGVGGSGTLTNVTLLAAGNSHAFAVTPDGVFGWGDNTLGRIGDGTTTNRFFPTQVLGVGGAGFLTGVTAISAGYAHSVAVNSSGVYSWGNNGSGRLGINSTSPSSSATPVQVVGVGGTGYLTGVTSVAAGQNHTLALTANGVFAWGGNTYGQLGVPQATSSSSSPVQVVGVGGSGTLSGVTSIATQADHNLALSPSKVFAWGDGADGKLGQGNTSVSSSPVEVPGVGGSGSLSGATSISTGARFSVVNTSQGVLGCGQNVFGQVGDGTITSPRTSPVLGPNFQPVSISFGSQLGTGMSNSGNSLTVLTPAVAAGTENVTAVSYLFGGVTASSPSSVSWNAGTFTFQAPTPPAPSATPSPTASASPTPSVQSAGSSPTTSSPLASTGYSYAATIGLLGALSLVAGLSLLLSRRRIQKQLAS